jgi:hypothetical protein
MTVSIPIAPVLAVLLIGAHAAMTPATGKKTAQYHPSEGGLHCEECFEGPSGHAFPGVACGTGDVEPMCFDCHVVNSCHSNAQPGTCNQFHSPCHRELGRSS